MWPKFLNWLLGPRVPKVCALCEERKLMLEQERAEKFRLLNVLLPNKEQEIRIENPPFTIIPSSRHRGWNAQRAELEANSRKEAEILREMKINGEKAKSLSDEAVSERIQEIEKELEEANADK